MSPRSLNHVLWIGGPPASGKTTIATRIARRHGLRWYNADTRTWAHRDRAVRAGIEAAIRLDALTTEERRAPTRIALELSLHRERGAMVVADLRALPRAPLVIAEGTTLPAAAVHDRSRAVWLLPTAEFQQAGLDERGHTGGARELFMLLAETIERDAREHEVPILDIDGARGIDETLNAVEQHFADALAAGPHAESLEERRALLREANEAVVAQVRGYFARPWADGDPDEVVRTFLCECGDPDCTADVQVRVGAAAVKPLVAAGHAG